MFRRRAATAALVLVTISGCRIALEDTVEYSSRTCAVSTATSCTDAVTHSDLKWIEDNIFNKCTFSGCHNGAATDAGRLDLSPGKSHAALVNVDSEIAAGPMLTGKAKLVVPMEPSRSYLLVMMRQLAPEQHDPPLSAPPASIGYMPQNAGGAVTCCQKLDALGRWIEEGAQNN
ncbi:MAG: hypothetical protein H0T46_33875 [Deltaproteobacteria bacterium]|nr:hypothetical protein [Deltaproteobacteria bacterium]